MTPKVYGVLGEGAVPKAAIEASLNDIQNGGIFLLPWYGKMTAGLEVVYDWIIDNDVEFEVIAAQGSKVPKAVTAEASGVQESVDVNREIISILGMTKGDALVLWSDGDGEAESVSLATMAIDHGVPTFELTNGLVPIVFDGGAHEESAIVDEADIISEDDPTDDVSPIEGFSRQEMESMPVATVKRHATQKGVDVKGKTKSDIIDSLYPSPTDDSLAVVASTTLAEATAPVSVIIVLNNGTSITVHGDQSTMNRIIAVL